MKNSKLDCLSEIRNELSHSSKIFKQYSSEQYPLILLIDLK